MDCPVCADERLTQAIDKFARAAVLLGERAEEYEGLTGKQSLTSEGYPFAESFDETVVRILDWRYSQTGRPNPRQHMLLAEQQGRHTSMMKDKLASQCCCMDGKMGASAACCPVCHSGPKCDYCHTAYGTIGTIDNKLVCAECE